MNRAVFWHGASFYLFYTAGLRIFKNKGTSLWKFVQNSGLRKFCIGISIVELSSTKVDATSVINWTVVGQLSWQYLRAPTLDRCSLSHVIVEFCLQHDSVARVTYSCSNTCSLVVLEIAVFVSRPLETEIPRPWSWSWSIGLGCFRDRSIVDIY